MSLDEIFIDSINGEHKMVIIFIIIVIFLTIHLIFLVDKIDALEEVKKQYEIQVKHFEEAVDVISKLQFDVHNLKCSIFFNKKENNK